MTRCCSALACAFALCLVAAPPARACGVSGPDGVWSCSLAEHEEALRPRWTAGAAGSYTSTALNFGHGVRADQTRAAIAATASYAPSARLALQISAGAGFAGRLQMLDGTHSFAPGPTGSIGMTYRLFDAAPFALLSAVLSGAEARTHSELSGDATYSAFDLRLGAIVGWTLFDMLSPYALARVFGGPVFWRDQGRSLTGTDVSHYQVGIGASLAVASLCQIALEAVPLGERALSGAAVFVF